MRAVQAQARLYHMVVTHMPEQLEDVPLGPLINGAGDFDGLRDVWTREGAENDSPLGLIISLLSSLNKIYRCPIMHPDMMLTGDTAKLVFDLAAIVISSMMQDAVDRSSGSATVDLCYGRRKHPLSSRQALIAGRWHLTRRLKMCLIDDFFLDKERIRKVVKDKIQVELHLDLAARQALENGCRRRGRNGGHKMGGSL